MDDQTALIRAHYAQLKRDTTLRAREIAAYLGLSEAELLAAHIGERATRLEPDWPGILSSLAPLGEVMALTRNSACIHEKIGVYAPFQREGSVGLVQGTEIDLRAYLPRWAHGFALEQEGRHGTQRSLQFFDAQGQAIHKIYLRQNSDLAAWDALCASYASQDQSLGISLAAPAACATNRADHEVDVAGLQSAWAGLRDTHDFAAMLRRFEVKREQGLRLAGANFARRVTLSSLELLLNAAKNRLLPVMVFTGNPGMLQIHSGTVHNLLIDDEWINLLDPSFNLHLRRNLLASCWVVKKPTADGRVSSLELYDAAGESVVWLFGARKPGKPELSAWRSLLDTLETRALSCAS